MKIIHVTESERSYSESVEALTKSQLKVNIFEVISHLNDDEAMFQEAVFNKSIKQKNKATYLEFYYKVCELDESRDATMEEESKLIEEEGNS